MQTETTAPQKYELVQNITGIEQIVNVGDKQFHLPPYSLRRLPSELANKFLSERGRFVRRHEEVDLPEDLGRPTTWVVNMTGSPFLPETLTQKKLSKGKWETEVVPNPNREPTVLHFHIDRGQKTLQSDAGTTYHNLGAVEIVLPPGMRKILPAKIAQQLLGRVANLDQDMQDRLILCNPPADFEPNESWSLKEIQTYATLLDKQTFTKEHLLSMLDGKSLKDLDPVRLEEVKHVLLSQVRYRLFDPRYTAPSEEVFKATLAEVDKKISPK
jgi:hypothetical protein